MDRRDFIKKATMAAAGAAVVSPVSAMLDNVTSKIGHPAEQPTPKDKWKPENVSYNEFGGKAE